MRNRGIEDILYEKLINSAAFHRFVRTIHAKMNGLPTPAQQEYKQRLQHRFASSANTREFQAFDNEQMFKVTKGQRFKAFRVIFWDELRQSFGFGSKKG